MAKVKDEEQCGDKLLAVLKELLADSSKILENQNEIMKMLAKDNAATAVGFQRV